MAGRLPKAEQAVGVLVIVIDFDYLLYSLMSSLAMCASIRTSNELGANRAVRAYQSAYISLGISVLSGLIGAAVMVITREVWGRLFTKDREMVNSVGKLLLILVVVEVFSTFGNIERYSGAKTGVLCQCNWALSVGFTCRSNFNIQLPSWHCWDLDRISGRNHFLLDYASVFHFKDQLG